MNQTTPSTTTSQILARLFVIHDQLPFRRSLRGLSASTIQQRLEAEGFDVNLRTVQRDLVLMKSLFFIESAAGQREELLWKRSSPENLSSRLRPGAGLE